MRRAESYLFSLGEVLINDTVELHGTNVADGELVFRPELGGIERVKLKLVKVCFRNSLDTKLPLGVCSVRDRFFKILAVIVRILTSELQSFIPLLNHHISIEYMPSDQNRNLPQNYAHRARVSKRT